MNKTKETAAKTRQVYIRDKRSPVPASEKVSRVMSKNKAKNTTPELIVRKILCKLGLKGYRLHPKDVPGKPDISFRSKKVAVFVNGCFWHRCPHCNYSLPKNNSTFWQQKFSNNINRDKQKLDELSKMRWESIVIWECQLRPDQIDRTIKLLEKKLIETEN